MDNSTLTQLEQVINDVTNPSNPSEDLVNQDISSQKQDSTLPVKDNPLVSDAPLVTNEEEQQKPEELQNTVMTRHARWQAMQRNAKNYYNANNALDTQESIARSKKEQAVYESGEPILPEYTDIDPNDPDYYRKRTANAVRAQQNQLLNTLTQNTGYLAQQKWVDLSLKSNAKEANAAEALEIKVREHRDGERLVTGYFEDGDTANVVVDGVETRFRIINGAISFDAIDDWGTRNKKYQIDQIAKRLGKAPHEVTEQDVADFKAWTNFVVVNAIKNNGFSKYEAFDPNKIDYYKQYVKENNHDLSYIIRPTIDNTSNQADVYGRPFVQILSADGKVNISDSLAMNSMFNLNKYRDSEETYFFLQPALRALITNDYANMQRHENYIKQKNLQIVTDNTPVPTKYTIFSPERLREFATGTLNSIPEMFNQASHWLQRAYYGATKDEDALAKVMLYYSDHPQLDLFGGPDESYQLYRQIANQEIIDVINRGGVMNIAKGFLLAATLNPVDSLIDSLPELLPLGIAGHWGVATKLATGSRLLGGLTTFSVAAITAGAQEMNTLENEYYIRTGHAMPMDLWTLSWLGATGVLMLELPAAMRWVGNPAALFNPKKYLATGGITAADTTFMGLMKKNVWDVLKNVGNEVVTEPVQNAYFNTMASMNSLADVPNFFSYYGSQWTGTHFGERIFEGGTALGMSALTGGNSLITNTALPYTYRAVNNALADPKDVELGKTAGNGTTLDDITLMKNNQAIKDIIVDFSKQRDKINTFLDPNHAQDDAAFTAEIKEMNKKLAVAHGRLSGLGGDTWSDAEKNLLDRQIKSNRAFIIAKQLEYAKRHGMDMDQAIAQIFQTQNYNATGNETLEEMRDWIEKQAAANLFGSLPKTIIETRLARVRKALEADPNNQHLKDMEQWLLDSYNEEQVELRFSDGRTLLVGKKAYEQFADIYRSYNPNATDIEVLDAIAKQWDIASMNDDIMNNGTYHNSISEYKDRIAQNSKDIVVAHNALKGQLINFNNKLPDGVEKLNEETIWAAMQTGNPKDIETLRAKYATYGNDIWNINTILDLAKRYNKLQWDLTDDFKNFNRFLDIRLRKTFGIADTIKEAVQNNVTGNVRFQYATTNGIAAFVIVMGQFYAGDLLHPSPNHKSLQLIKYVFEETIATLNTYKEVSDILKADLPEKVPQFIAQDAEEGIAKVQSVWNDLIELQRGIHSSSNTKQKREQQASTNALEEAKSILLPILIAAAKKIADPATQAAYINILTSPDVDWVEQAQQYTIKQINSNYCKDTGFNFKSLYLSLDANLRTQVKAALAAAFNKLPEDKRTRADLASGTNAQKDALLQVAPYKDKNKNYLYNLLQQINAAEKIEAQQGKQQPSDNTQQQKNRPLTQQERNVWNRIEAYLKKMVKKNKTSVFDFRYNKAKQTITVNFTNGDTLVFDYSSGQLVYNVKKTKKQWTQPLAIINRTSPSFIEYDALVHIFFECYHAASINKDAPNPRVDPTVQDDSISNIPTDERIPQGTTEYQILPLDQQKRKETTVLNGLDFSKKGKVVLIKRTTQTYEQYIANMSAVSKNDSRGLGIWDDNPDYDTIMLPDGSIMTRPGSDPYSWNGMDIRNFPKDQLPEPDAIPIMKGYSNNGSEYIICYNPKTKKGYMRRVKFPDPESKGRDFGLQKEFMTILADPKIAGFRDVDKTGFMEMPVKNIMRNLLKTDNARPFFDSEGHLGVYEIDKNHKPTGRTFMMPRLDMYISPDGKNMVDTEEYIKTVVQASKARQPQNHKYRGYKPVSTFYLYNFKISQIIGDPDDDNTIDSFDFDAAEQHANTLPDQLKECKYNLDTEYSDYFKIISNIGYSARDTVVNGQTVFGIYNLHPSSGLHYIEKCIPGAIDAIRQIQGLPPLDTNQEAEGAEEAPSEEDNIPPFDDTIDNEGVVVDDDLDAETTQEDVAASAKEPAVIFSKLLMMLRSNRFYIEANLLVAHKAEVLKDLSKKDYSNYKDFLPLARAFARKYMPKNSSGGSYADIDLDWSMYDTNGDFRKITSTAVNNLLGAIEQQVQNDPNSTKNNTYRKLAWMISRTQHVYIDDEKTILRAGYAYGLLLTAIERLKKNDAFKDDPILKLIQANPIVGAAKSNSFTSSKGSSVRIYLAKNDFITVHYDFLPEDDAKGLIYNQKDKCYYYGDRPIYFSGIRENTPFVAGANFYNFRLVAPTSFDYNGTTRPFSNDYYIADADIVIDDGSFQEDEYTPSDIPSEEEFSQQEESNIPPSDIYNEPSNEDFFDVEEENSPVMEMGHAEETEYTDEVAEIKLQDKVRHDKQWIPPEDVEDGDKIKNMYFGLNFPLVQFLVRKKLSTSKKVKTLQATPENIITLARLIHAWTDWYDEGKSLSSLPKGWDYTYNNDIRKAVEDIQESLGRLCNIWEVAPLPILDMFRTGVFMASDGTNTVQMRIPTVGILYNKNAVLDITQASPDYNYVTEDGKTVVPGMGGRFTIIRTNKTPLGGSPLGAARLKGELVVAPIDASDGTTVIKDPDPAFDPGNPDSQRQEENPLKDVDIEINTDPVINIENEENVDTEESVEQEIAPEQGKPAFNVEGLEHLQPFTNEERNRWKTGCYAGIGSRETPVIWLNWMTKAATKLQGLGLVLRSGHAKGADTAFENGADKSRREIFTVSDIETDRFHTAELAKELAMAEHPAGRNLQKNSIGLDLHARNGYQVLGAGLNKPVDFILCWTPPDGVAYGGSKRTTHGTNQALRLADAMNIPIFNMYIKGEEQRFYDWMKNVYLPSKPKGAVATSEISAETIGEVSSMGTGIGAELAAPQLEIRIPGYKQPIKVEAAYQASKWTANSTENSWTALLHKPDENKGKSFTGNKLDVWLPYDKIIPQAYFVLYMQGLRGYIAKPKGANNLKTFLQSTDRFTDSYDINSIASQADMLTFLKMWAEKNGYDNAFNIISQIDYHNPNSYNSFLDEFSKWFKTTDKYKKEKKAEEARELERKREEAAEKFKKNPPSDSEIYQELDLLFENLYKEGKISKLSVFYGTPFLDAGRAMAKANATSINQVGWSTILTNFIGSLEKSSPRVYKLLKNIADSPEFVMNAMTNDVGSKKTQDHRSLITKLEKGYTIDSFVNAMSGTDSFLNVAYKEDEDVAIRLNANHYLNQIVISKSQVNKAALAKAIYDICVDFLKPNSKLEKVTMNEVLSNLLESGKIGNTNITEQKADKLFDIVDKIQQGSVGMTFYTRGWFDEVLKELDLLDIYKVAEDALIKQKDAAKTQDTVVTKTQSELEQELNNIKTTYETKTFRKQSLGTIMTINDTMEFIADVTKSITAYKKFDTANPTIIANAQAYISELLRLINIEAKGQREDGYTDSRYKDYDEMMKTYLDEFTAQSENLEKIKVLTADDLLNAVGAVEIQSTTEEREENAAALDNLLHRNTAYSNFVPTYVDKHGHYFYKYDKATPSIVNMFRGLCDLFELSGGNISTTPINTKTLVPAHITRILEVEDIESKVVTAGLSKKQITDMENIINSACNLSVDNLFYSTDIIDIYSKLTNTSTEEAKAYLNTHPISKMPVELAATLLLKIIEKDPSLLLLYNFGFDEGEITITLNKTAAYAIYAEAISSLVNYSSLTQRPTDKVCADNLGIDENQFTMMPEKNYYKKLFNQIGNPAYNVSVKLGRNIAQRLNLKLRAKGEVNVTLGNRVETTFGKLATRMIEVINNKQIESVLNKKENANEAFLQIKKLAEDAYAYRKNPFTTLQYPQIYIDFEQRFPYDMWGAKNGVQLSNEMPIDEVIWFMIEHFEYFEHNFNGSSLVKDLKELKEKGAVSVIRTSRIGEQDVKAYSDIGTPLKDSNFLKIRGLGKATPLYQKVKERYDILQNFYIATDEDMRGVSHQPFTDVAQTVTNFANTPVGNTQKTALRNLQNTPHSFDEEAMKIFLNHELSIFYAEGGKDNEMGKNLTEEERLSNKNSSLGRSFAVLKSLYSTISDADNNITDPINNAFYIKYNIMKNMRFNVKSVFNPQQDKAARWLTYAGKEREFDINDTKAVKFEKWALANAFDMVSKDSKVDKCFDILMDICKSPNKMKEFEDDACCLSASDFEDKWGLGIENRFQVISAIAHLKKRAKAMQSDGKFMTTLRVEIDSTTSGYFLRFMTYLDANIINKFGTKVGLVTSINQQLGLIAYGTDITDYESMESYKKAINDIYREIAVEMSKDDGRLLKETWNDVKNFGWTELTDKGYTKKHPFFADYKEFSAFITSMPSATYQNGSWDVSSDLRALLKKVVMVFGYSAGEATMEHNLSEAYAEEYGGKANDAMRDFLDRVKDPKKITLQEYQDAWQKIKASSDAMTVKYISSVGKLFKMFTKGRMYRKDNTSGWYLNNNGFKAPYGANQLILQAINAGPTGVKDEELRDFIRYFNYFRLQVEGITDDSGNHYDILPEDFIYETETVGSEKNPRSIPRSIGYAINQLFDLTAGKACITAMKSFSHLSHDNMVLSTIGTLLNSEAKNSFNQAIDEGLAQYYGLDFSKGTESLEYKSQRADIIANQVTFEDYQKFIDLYLLRHPEKQELFSTITTAFSLMDGDEYRLQVSDAEWQNVRGEHSPINNAFAIVCTPITKNTTDYWNNYSLDRRTTTQGYVTRERQLIDIGLVPTASTVQALDAAVMTLFVNICKERGIDITSVHDAGVVSFLDTAKASQYYNVLAYLVCSKMCVKMQYIMQALNQMKRLYPQELSNVINNGDTKSISLRKTKLLTDLSYHNLNKLFGIQSAQEYYKDFSKGMPKYYGEGAEDGYIDQFATVHNYIKTLLNEAYEIQHNWDIFYNGAELYIRNMGGMATGITTGNLDAFIKNLQKEEKEIRKHDNKDPRLNDYNLTGIVKLSKVDDMEKLTKEYEKLLNSVYKKPETLSSLDEDLHVTTPWTEILSKADSCNSAAIIEVLDRLPRSVKDDPRAIANFKLFLSQLDLSNMAGFSVQVAKTDSIITQGVTEMSQGIIKLAINDKNTSTVNPSPATVYMHEVLHALLNYAFEERKNNPQINRLLEKLRVLQDMAAKVITVEDLIGNTKTINPEDIQVANNIWNYVFNNTDDNDRGLKEFLSYAVTDKTFIEKLSQVKIPNTRTSLYTRVKQFLLTLWNLITLKTTIGEEVAKRNLFTNTGLNKYQGQDVYNATLNLIKDIQDANAKATTNIPIATKTVYNFYKVVNTLRTCGNKYLVRFTRDLFNLTKSTKVAVMHPTTADIVKTLMLLPFSSAARKTWYDIVSRTCTHYEFQDIRLLIDDFGNTDQQREALDEYARRNRAAEAYYQQVRGVVLDTLQANFGRDLTQEEHKVLTKLILRTDLECLYNGKNYSSIKKLLQDRKYLTNIISDYQTQEFELNPIMIGQIAYDVKLSDKSIKTLLTGIDQLSTKWAYTLYYGKGDNLIGTADDINSIGDRLETVLFQQIKNDNPQIAKDVIKSREFKKAIMDLIKNRLNKLTTLKALDITFRKEPNTAAILRKLSDKGIETILLEHQGFKSNIRRTKSALERMKEQGKGYLASQYNQAVSYKILPLSEKDKMEYNGYTLVENLHDKKNLLLDTGTGLVLKNNVPMGIFVKKDIILDKRSNSAFSFIASKWSAKDIYSYLSDGITLEQALLDRVIQGVDAQIAANRISLDQRDAMIARKTKIEIEQRYFKLIAQYRNKEMFNAFQPTYKKSEAQIEQDILNSAFDGDSYNPLTIQEKVEKLKQSENAFDILSKQIATQTTFNNGRRQNIYLVNLLKDFAKYNMNPTTHRDKITLKNYVNITDRLVNELHISKDILCGENYVAGQPIPDIWAREDFVERLFGVKAVNLSQATIKRGPRAGYSKYPPLMRKSFEILERILKILGYKEKETIVVRKPRVLIGNVMSNLSYNCLSEPNWVKVASMQLANIENTNNYLQAQKRAIEIEHKIRINTATDEERAERNRLIDRMDNNPISPLFKNNMFTSIVEDISLKDKEAVTDYFNKIADSKLVNKLPNALKVMFNQAYMRQGTPIFDAFYNINKYSDFIARATEYQIQMEKHKEEIAKNPRRKPIIQQEVLRDVWNAFIDYDRPNGKWEQYLNDTGILMFTKYAKGIQRVIMKQLTNNPMGLMIHLAREAAVPFDIEDIYEANVFNKDWGLMFHNPFSNLIDVVVPPLPRLVLGML